MYWKSRSHLRTQFDTTICNPQSQIARKGIHRKQTSTSFHSYHIITPRLLEDYYFIPLLDPCYVIIMVDKFRTDPSEEDSDNDFSWNGIDNGDTVDDILALKNANLKNPRRFTIRNHRCDGYLLRVLMDVFRYFSENQILWETFELDDVDSFEMDDDSECQYFIRPLLLTANMMSIFKRIKVAAFTDGPEEPVGDLILAGVTQNTKLQSLEVLYGINQGDFEPLICLLHTTSTLRELMIGMELESSELTRFSNALAANKTLVKLELWLGGSHISDEGFSRVITVLANHPKLALLSINVSGCCGPFTSGALQNLLSSSSTLTTLRLQYFDAVGHDSGKISVDHIVEGLRRNSSLRRLALSNATDGNMVLSRIFPQLKDCPALQVLTLDRHITRADLEHVMRMERLNRPIFLNLHGTVINRFPATVEALLRSHPEIQLHNMSLHEYKEQSASFQHIYDMNWHGRYLLNRPKVPLALWPLVLQKARAGMAFPNTEASVIYEFLKGPVLAGRI